MSSSCVPDLHQSKQVKQSSGLFLNASGGKTLAISRSNPTHVKPTFYTLTKSSPCPIFSILFSFCFTKLSRQGSNFSSEQQHFSYLKGALPVTPTSLHRLKHPMLLLLFLLPCFQSSSSSKSWTLNQRLENFFWKASDSKYFRLCRP